MKRRPVSWLFFSGAAFVLLWAARVDVPRLTGGIKGDEATYTAMALSLGRDGDLTYRQEDYRRFQQVWHSGPNGIFLKRTSDPSALGFGKSFAYAAFAAPFVLVFGLNGLLVMNVVLLWLCLWCAAVFGRARTGSLGGALFGLAFILASAVPVYGAWLTPELLNVALILVALFLWLYKFVAPSSPRTWLHAPGLELVSAVLLGLATYSKPWHGVLIGALVLAALAARKWTRAVVIGVVFLGTTVGLFGINALVTGDWNFQGGDRRYFYGPDRFPFDERGTTFDSPGASEGSATNEANDEKLLDPQLIAASLPLNVFYFVTGRDAGLIPYFFPGFLVVLWWLVRWREATIWQTSTLVATAASVLAILLLAPALWNGGGGPVGNRYFLPIYPALLFLMPGSGALVGSLISAVVGLTFVGAILVHPFAASRSVWLNPARWPLRLLPIELTIMEQLPVRLNHDRARIDGSKDPQVLLYYMDNHGFSQERDGFWVEGGATSEIVVRTEFPLTRLDLRLHSAVANEVDISIGGRSSHITLRPNEEAALQFHPKPGVAAKHGGYWSYHVVWRISTSAGFHPRDFDPTSSDTRYLGVFLSPKYAVK